ncbi:hypothetical protein [Pseudomonas sp. CC120222-01a]|uniref:hypothetical protein n=1 Tax=Pseudomonas sp. CC120222-01a TaxID=1378075 RepID=UPI000D8DD782|nr:hypothetical protein [Pseudomonas sp. CC120222-01a]
MPSLDEDLRRVTHVHYVTGNAAVNFHWPGKATGGWHRLSYWDSSVGRVRVALAGIHYPDTTRYFAEVGIVNASRELERQGWLIEGDIFMANHYRATADMVVTWALGSSKHCNVDLADWFPEDAESQQVIDLLASALPKLDQLPRKRLSQWLECQQQ